MRNAWIAKGLKTILDVPSDAEMFNISKLNALCYSTVNSEPQPSTVAKFTHQPLHPNFISAPFTYDTEEGENILLHNSFEMMSGECSKCEGAGLAALRRYLDIYTQRSAW
jgi:hypothetical protein